MNINKKAFTLIELIVVITILAILSTIGFVSYSGYLAGTRDTSRIASLKAISEGLEIYGSKHTLPNPDATVISISDGSTLIAKQGYAGKNVLEAISYSTEGVDPKSGTYYSYYLTADKKYFQLMAFLEEEENLQTSATATDYSIMYPTVFGDKLGILTSKDNTPLQEIASVITTGQIDVADVGSLELKAILKDNDYLSGSGTTFSSIANFAESGGKFCSSSNLTCEDLTTISDWRSVDPNCDVADIVVGDQTWAGCNSTIGTGVEFVETVDNSCSACYDYQGNDGQECSDSENLSNKKESSWNSTYGINNIWGKTYTLDNAKTTACTNGYHLPTESEWDILVSSLGGGSNLGWDGHTSLTDNNNIINALKMPLSGHTTISDSDKNCARGYRIYLWFNTSDYVIRFASYETGFKEESFDGSTYRFSVRCIKD